MPDIDDIVFSSSLSGLGNYSSADGSLSIAGRSLGAFASFTETLTIPMEREDAISQIQTKYTGLETIWRLLSGRHIIYKPSFGAASYTVRAYPSFSGTSLSINVEVRNATGAGISTPSFTLDCRVSLYTAPFAP